MTGWGGNGSTRCVIKRTWRGGHAVTRSLSRSDYSAVARGKALVCLSLSLSRSDQSAVARVRPTYMLIPVPIAERLKRRSAG